MDYGLITSVEELSFTVSMLLSMNEPAGVDIETGYLGNPRERASLHPEENFIVGLSLGTTSWARYIPLAHDTMAVNLPADEVAEVLKPLAESGLSVAHNAKFEIRNLEVPVTEGGLGLNWKMRSDSMVEAYVVQEYPAIGLKDLVETMFGHRMTNIAELFPETTKVALRKLRFNELDLTPEVVSYACEDALWCVRVHERLFDRVKDSAIFQVEMGLIPIMAAMERAGLRYDWDAMSAKALELEQFVARLDELIQLELSELVGEAVSVKLSSPQQLVEVLYEKLKLPVRVLTPKGAPSTSAVALEKLRHEYPVVQHILWWKEARRLHGTYLKRYPKNYNYAPDGRTHPDISSTLVVSGRFAVSHPAYQQTPKNYRYELSDGTTFSCSFRSFIVPEPGRYFLYFDYSQVELRVLAGVSKEPGLLRPFAAGTDVHTATASLMLGVPESQVTEEQRAIGKTMNFALLYGMSVKSLAQRLAVSKTRAQDLYDRYFSAFTSISVWMNEQRQIGRHQGFTESFLGRRHRIWEFESANGYIRSKAERLCINAPIQGGAADYMKVAMYRQDQVLRKAGLLDRVTLVMNNHDSLTWEVDCDLSPTELIQLLDPAVSFPVEGFPPIVADWAVASHDWSQLVPVDKESRASSIYEIVGEPEVQQDDETTVPATYFRPVEPEPTTIRVRVPAMPTRPQMAQFLSLLEGCQDGTKVVLETPQGELVAHESANISLAHKSQMSMIFGVLVDVSVTGRVSTDHTDQILNGVVL